MTSPPRHAHRLGAEAEGLAGRVRYIARSTTMGASAVISPDTSVSSRPAIWFTWMVVRLPGARS
jgi:hypothetical protein